VSLLVPEGVGAEGGGRGAGFVGEGEGGAVGGGPGLRGSVFRGGGFGRWFVAGFGGFVMGRKGGFDFHGEEVVGEFFV